MQPWLDRTDIYTSQKRESVYAFVSRLSGRLTSQNRGIKNVRLGDITNRYINNMGLGKTTFR